MNEFWWAYWHGSNGWNLLGRTTSRRRGKDLLEQHAEHLIPWYNGRTYSSGSSVRGRTYYVGSSPTPLI